MNNKNFLGGGASNQGGASYALFNPMDVYEDEIYAKLQRTVPHMSALSWLKQIAGRHGKRRVKRSEYSFYEEQQFIKAAATIASITPNGAMFDIVLSAGDHGDIGGTDESSYPVEGMSCLFQDGKTTGYVNTVTRTTPGAHMVTVKKWNSSQDIGTVATVGSVIMFFSNAQIEKSTKTEGRSEQFEKITNKLQIVREFYDTTDVELQNQTWIEFENGKKYLYYHNIDKTAQRFQFQKEAAVLLTPQASGLTNKNSKPINSAFGLIPQIDQHGITLEYFNKPDGAAFDEVILALDNNFAEKSYIVGHGINLMLKLKDYLKEFAANGTGNISFSPFNGGEEQAIKLNFKSYSVGAYEFYFQQWDIFGHKDSLGAPGLPFRHMGIFIPTGNASNPNPDGYPDVPHYVPYIQLISPTWGRAASSHADKGDYLMWETGALAVPFPTNDELGVGVHMATYIGLEMHCRHKFAKWELA
jgi:hypothetical protein